MGDRESDPWQVSDEGIDAWAAEWEEADRQAVGVLAEALAEQRGQAPPADQLASASSRLRDGLRSAHYPFDWIGRGAGLAADLPGDDRELLLDCLAATISPREETGLEIEEESMLISLEHADWLGAIISSVRAGPGADASPEALVRGIHSCPEVDVDPGLDDDDELVETAFVLVSPAWLALGVLDEGDRLTRLGCWALPRALASAWGADFDGRPG